MKELSLVRCETGYNVIEGGYENTPLNTGSVPPFIKIHRPILTPSNPNIKEDDQEYLVMAYGGGVRIQAYEYCFENPPLRP